MRLLVLVETFTQAINMKTKQWKRTGLEDENGINWTLDQSGSFARIGEINQEGWIPGHFFNVESPDELLIVGEEMVNAYLEQVALHRERQEVLGD